MGLEREGFPPQSLRQGRKTSKLTCNLEETDGFCRDEKLGGPGP